MQNAICKFYLHFSNNIWPIYTKTSKVSNYSKAETIKGKRLAKRQRRRRRVANCFGPGPDHWTIATSSRKMQQ